MQTLLCYPVFLSGFVICSRDEANMEMDSMNWGYSNDEPGHFDFESLEDVENLGYKKSY